MNYDEFIKAKKIHDKAILKLETKYIKSNTYLRKKDNVRFTKKGDSYNGEEDEIIKAEIYGFQINGKNIYVQCKGIHYNPLTTDCRKYGNKK